MPDPAPRQIFTSGRRRRPRWATIVLVVGVGAVLIAALAAIIWIATAP